MSQTTTFAQLKNFAVRRFSDRKDAKAVAQISEAIQDALRNLAQAKDWEHLEDEYRLTTVAEYTTGTVAINAGSTSLALTGGSFVGNGVTSLWAAKLNGESTDYRFATSISSTRATLGSVYVGTGNLSGATYIAYQRSYNLPTNLQKLKRIVDVRRPRVPLGRMTFHEILAELQARSNGATPTHYCVRNLKGGAQRQLWLYPFPSGSTRFQYDIQYQRYPTIPSADADVIDWPDQLMNVLRAQIEVELSLKSEDFQVSANARDLLAEKLQDASKSDVDETASIYMGRRGPGRTVFDPTNFNATEGGP